MYSGPGVVKSVKERGRLKGGSVRKRLFATDIAGSADFILAVVISVIAISGDAISGDAIWEEANGSMPELLEVSRSGCRL